LEIPRENAIHYAFDLFIFLTIQLIICVITLQVSFFKVENNLTLPQWTAADSTAIIEIRVQKGMKGKEDSEERIVARTSKSIYFIQFMGRRRTVYKKVALVQMLFMSLC
jgi:hypothetical protein